MLVLLAPLAAIMSIELAAIISSRVSDVRGATQIGSLMFVPFMVIFLAGVEGTFAFTIPNLLIISAIVLAIDVALFFLRYVHLQSRRDIDEVEVTGAKIERSDRVSGFLTRKSLTSTTAIVCYLALADFIIHMLFAGNYGYFRDALYYIVSGTQHLSLGYVDFPPFIAYVAALVMYFPEILWSPFCRFSSR